MYQILFFLLLGFTLRNHIVTILAYTIGIIWGLSLVLGKLLLIGLGIFEVTKECVKTLSLKPWNEVINQSKGV